MIQVGTKEKLRSLIRKTIKEKGNNCDLNFIDTSLITDMSSLFFSSEFNGDISKWDVSNVRSMYYMFSLSRFNKDISNWNVSSVKNLSNIFYKSEFTIGYLNNWKKYIKYIDKYIDKKLLKPKFIEINY